MNFAPADDPTIECNVRLWKGESVHVFVSPKEWKHVSIVGGVPMLVTTNAIEFPCLVLNIGEHYRMGRPEGIRPDIFGVPTHADYQSTARIDWEKAIPDLLRDGIERSKELSTIWCALSCKEMRDHLSFVFRARNPGAIAERQLALLQRLGNVTKQGGA